MGSPRSAEFIRLVRPRALPGSSPVQQGELSRFFPTPHTFADLGLNTPREVSLPSSLFYENVTSAQ